jgi:hypothetical protein
VKRFEAGADAVEDRFGFHPIGCKAEQPDDDVVVMIR